MAKKRLYFLWMLHGGRFLNGEFKNDFDGYVKAFKGYPMQRHKSFQQRKRRLWPLSSLPPKGRTTIG